MIPFVQALIPIVILVMMGWLLAARNFVPEEGWRAMERLTYFVFFPALIVQLLAKASFETAPLGMALALVGAQLFLGLIGLTSRQNGDNKQTGSPRKGSIIQSNVRWNTFIGLSIAGTLFGEQGLVLMAFAAAILTSVANVMSVWALTRYAASNGKPKPHITVDLLRNPLIIACAIGFALNMLGLAPTGIMEEALNILGDATLALGLLVLGAAVDIAAFRRAGKTTMIWSVIRLTAFPLATLGIGLILDLSPLNFAIVVIAAATPTASSGYILSRQLGGDATLSANLIAVQTVVSMLTMPAIYALFLMTQR